MSADPRPAETASWQWRESELAAVTAQLGQAQSEHVKAMELPAVPGAESKHAGGSDAGYPA